MRRREVLRLSGVTALSALTTSLGSAGAQSLSLIKPKIIMVHGSWHWGGCFAKVANTLAEAGYPVATPDLASHGYSDRSYDSFSTMSEYVEPVETMLKNTDAPVVLLGHSLGGATLTYLGEKYPEKISKLLYLTAFMIPNGKTIVDYTKRSAGNPSSKGLRSIVESVGGGRGAKLNTNDLAIVKAALYADCSDHDVSIALKNCIPVTSTIPYTLVSEVTPSRFGKIPRVLIECTLDKAIPIESQRLMVEEMPGAKVISLETSHSSFFSRPTELAKIIIANA
jgi:pimeloyl-ACP methyl ester carboxylesterase